MATSPSSTMRACVQEQYGTVPADVLLFDEAAPLPGAPGKGQVLVRVVDASLQRGDWHTMTGEPYLIRAFGFGLRSPAQRVPGQDMAGVVEAVGAGVTRFQPGDRVFGEGAGCFAELALCDANTLAAMPAGLSFADAASLPNSALTALQAVRDLGAVKAGQRVLVLGASGGVGQFAVQIAKSLGAHVTGVCSAAKECMVRAIGADETLDYRVRDFHQTDLKWDCIVATAGEHALQTLRDALPDAQSGTLVLVGGEGGGKWFGNVGRTISASLRDSFTKQNLRAAMVAINVADLETVAQMAVDGRLRSTVDTAHTYQLEQVSQAMQDMIDGQITGKAVIHIANPAA